MHMYKSKCSVYINILLHRLKKEQNLAEQHIQKPKMEMEFQEDQELEGSVDKKDLQDQLEKLDHQENQE